MSLQNELLTRFQVGEKGENLLPAVLYSTLFGIMLSTILVVAQGEEIPVNGEYRGHPEIYRLLTQW